MTESGEIVKSREWVQWVIKQFQRHGRPPPTFSSPYFKFADRVWGLEIDSEVHDNRTWVAVILTNFCEPDPNDYVSLGIKVCEGAIMRDAVPSGSGEKFTAKLVKYYDTSSARWLQILPQGDLTVVCKIGTQSTSIEKLLLDQKQMYLSGQNSDVVLRVDRQEFKAHRCILAARSPVFAAMFSHNMQENVSGIVTVEDNDSDTFSEFLHYLYAGSVENMTPENAPRLYMTADKYQVAELKEECLDFMVNNITEESICDFLSLALRHRERELIDAAKNVLTEQEKSPL